MIPVKVGTFLTNYVFLLLLSCADATCDTINEEKASKISPSTEVQSKIQKLPGDICKHYNKQCTAKGTAFQREVCYSWMNVACEGISYKLFNKLSSAIKHSILL